MPVNEQGKTVYWNIALFSEEFMVSKTRKEQWLQTDDTYLLLNGVIVNNKKGISYEGPPHVATSIRSPAMFHEFMEKLYHVTVYEK